MNSRYFTTGIGSLPVKDPESAVKYVFENYSLPFFPQLVPMLEELEPKGMTPAQVVQRQPATEPFLTRLGGLDDVKIQLAGPVTLQRTDNGVDRWDWVEQLTRTWVERLREMTEGVIHFLWDDALLAAESGPAERARFQAFAASLLGERVALGLHCCSALKLDQLTATARGMTLAVDAHVVDLVSPTASNAAKAHVEAGGRFILGVVDTRQKSVDAGAAQTLLASILQAWRDVPPEGILGVSGGCGTALHSESYERAVAEALNHCVTAR